jgi:plasmid maintenance system antidote protein VapI
MHRILKGEMVKKNIQVKKLAMNIGITERSLRNKINGVTEFTLSEAIKIHTHVSPEMILEELFTNEKSSA